ncbi:hypothetical protein B0H16DRAFT_286362 [Mycena metata]|uniref:GATA-type domain-containing protein n=1 Tax=Mycena metata TaxID=1033252 RepID=A0AAD7HQE5_9AGAR|nr:hypothetical protein B0H16DRAFT_286362 [Mycena metata]
MRKRKHTALDDASFGEDEAPLSDSRLLRALPRRGRSRNIAASAATDDELAASSPRPPHVSSAATDTQPDPVPEATDTTAALDGLVSVPTRTSKRRRLDAQTSSTAGSSRNTGTSVGHSAGENDGNGLAPPPPPARSCRNCGSTTTSGGAWYNSKLLLVKICRACYQYEKTHSRCRTFDMAERARLKAHIRPALQSGQRCGNCGTESNVCYISKLLFVKICSGCYQYERSHSECRPKCRERPQRPQYLTECGNCHSKTTHGGGWHNSVANPDSQLRRCQACYEYESKKGKPRPESLYQKPPRGPMVKCNNCGEKNTREWRTDSEGKTVCDESVFPSMI